MSGDNSENNEEPTNTDEESLPVQVLQNSLSPDFLEEAIAKAREAFRTSRVEKDVATAIKKHFDGKIFASTCMFHCVSRALWL